MNPSVAAFAVLLVAAAFLAQSQAWNDPSFCCFSYKEKPIPVKLVKSFEHTNYQCAMPAVILYTKGGRKFCADPQQTWVKNILSHFQ
ncbi:C-C motif chemokine 5-like [Elgaria multicarinata webbii]|uniref:C-C motif chemokine 5-like n=1 Tax=Elgaria multicarinata webbii TaxID=159646 RepID=UPI002FCCFAEA